MTESTLVTPTPPVLKPADELLCGFNTLQITKRGFMIYPRFDAVIGASLSYYGEYAENDLAIISQLIHPGDHVLEIGAHVGVHTLGMAQQVGPSGVVMAFEPQRILFQALCGNMALNGITNTHCAHFAAGENSDMLKVPFIDYFQPQDFAQIAPTRMGDGESVKQVCIDELRLQRCDFIKMSSFFQSIDVIRGATQTLEQLKPLLYIEWTSCDSKPGLIYTILKSMGYKMYWSLSPLFNAQNFNQKEDDILGNALLINILCAHESKDFTFQGFTPIQSPADDWRILLEEFKK